MSSKNIKNFPRAAADKTTIFSDRTGFLQFFANFPAFLSEIVNLLRTTATYRLPRNENRQHDRDDDQPRRRVEIRIVTVIEQKLHYTDPAGHLDEKIDEPRGLARRMQG